MSVVEREREVPRNPGDNRSEEMEASPGGVAPEGQRAVREMAVPAQDREGTPPGGQATSAGGGYGIGSERGSGGAGEATQPAGEDDETDWLREADGGPK